jgi:hypothetical protein
MPLSSHEGDRPRRGGSPPPCLEGDTYAAFNREVLTGGHMMMSSNVSLIPKGSPGSFPRYSVRRPARTWLPPGRLHNGPFLSFHPTAGATIARTSATASASRP